MTTLLARTPTLQAETSNGGQKFWFCEAHEADGEVTLVSSAWITKQDGSSSVVKISAPSRVDGKNLGRSNATSPRDQALLELNQKLRKKLDEGYLDPLATDTSGSSKAWNPPILPMLAHPYAERAHTVPWSQMPITQPKLDGQRVLYQNGEFWSRQGKQLDPQITAHLELPDTAGVILDGELLLPSGYGFQDTMRAIKKYRPELSPLLEYHLYDAVIPTSPDLSFSGRYAQLLSLLEGAGPGIHLVRNTAVSSEAELLEAHAANLAAGYEGSMLRTQSGAYKNGHRSVDLLKVKDFKDAEYPVIGYSSGRGRDEEAILFTCRTSGGKSFEVRPAWTLEARRAAYLEGDTYLGQQLTVKFFELTDEGLPRFPVGIGFGADRQA